MSSIAPHLMALTPLATAGVGGLLVWLRMRPKDEADAAKARTEAMATDAEVGRQLREELRAEIADLRAEQERRDADCERRLKAMEAALADAQRVVQANGRTIAKQADTIDRLKARVTELESKAA